MENMKNENKIDKNDQEDSLELLRTQIDGRESFRPEVSSAVIKRLPRYFRYLRELIRMGKTRVSSSELSKMMNVTASQIRQDLNCFGGFGQQGYGYNVNYLYTKICEILGVGFGFRAAVIGAGNLGSALVRSPMFEKRGVDVVAMFDISSSIVGKKIGEIRVYHMDEMEKILHDFGVDIVILTLPKEHAVQISERLVNSGIHGIWNFTGKELALGNCGIVVENVHIGDSLMTLCYEIAQSMDKNSGKQ